MSEEFFGALARLARRRSRLLTEEAVLCNELGELLARLPSPQESAVPSHASTLAADQLSGDKLLPVHQAADLLGISSQTLNKWRVTGGGPEFVKLGRRVLYRRDALDRFVADRARPHTSAYSIVPPRPIARQARDIRR